jgi:hypothetical protein
MTEQEVRALGLDQINAGLVMSALYAQAIRREALEVLFADAGADRGARAAVIHACKLHPDARWWLLHKRGYGADAAAHWAGVLGEEVNRATAVGPFPTT